LYEIGDADFYPSVAPTSSQIWKSTTGVGDPTSNPGGWTSLGAGSAAYDGGGLWKSNFGTSGLSVGNFLISRFVYPAGTTPYSNVVTVS
jgi:hypothetical protein